MRPLHLGLRNVLGGREGGLRRREGGQRRGDCLEACVSISSRSLPVFLEIKVGPGGTAHASSRRQLGAGGQEASSEPRLLARILNEPAFFPTFPRPPRWTWDRQRSSKGVRWPPGPCSPISQRHLGEDAFRTETSGHLGGAGRVSLCPGLGLCARDSGVPGSCGVSASIKAPEARLSGFGEREDGRERTTLCPGVLG